MPISPHAEPNEGSIVEPAPPQPDEADQSPSNLEAQNKEDNVARNVAYAAKSATSAETPAHLADDVPYGCNICFETAQDAVVTQCGHLHCWACLHEWFSTPQQSQSPTCPVCKATTGPHRVVPIYGAGSQGQDPRKKLKWAPPRPRGRVATDLSGASRTGTMAVAPPLGRVTFQAGVFPLPGLGFTWSSGGGFQGPGHVNEQGPRNEAEYLSDMMQKLLTVLFIAMFVAMAFS
ncbi:hypothetical protein ACM66B_001013 [Microbotryomycetes sp. NB124-2]